MGTSLKKCNSSGLLHLPPPTPAGPFSAAMIRCSLCGMPSGQLLSGLGTSSGFSTQTSAAGRSPKNFDDRGKSMESPRSDDGTAQYGRNSKLDFPGCPALVAAHVEIYFCLASEPRDLLRERPSSRATGCSVLLRNRLRKLA